MTSTYSGGCACGEIRYEVQDAPVFQNHCQCHDCQCRSGTGHGSYLTFPDRTRVKIFGKAKLWEVVADSGNKKSNAFCPTCGSPVFLTFAAMPAIFTVHAASLDSPGDFNPQVVTYTASAQSWDKLDPSLTKFERMPT
ncbi:GFA family protein [Rhodoferax mekongensis]|uniref:GFA family protein n=1 Tax=Rhodoferax mekongensis TaxID=3068341 RepID=UPI0028BD7FCC|nr:GFA family protein [Rhodoferax sp. TBRC 17199]MDT7515603.1 GFA family protein [Rhodoferax sp. TBRC 17199]